MDNSLYSPGLETKLSIAAALNELCKEKSYQRVSVTEICQLADVNRSTFYHHFDDKNAILQWHSLAAYEMGIDKIGRTYNWLQGHLITTRILKKFETAQRKAGDDVGYSSLKEYFERHRVENLSETLTDYQHKELTDEMQFQILACASLESHLGGKHLKEMTHVSDERYCEMLTRSVPRELFNALNTPVAIDCDADLLLLMNGGLA